MSFLSDLAADLQASVTKTATTAYQAGLNKAQDAANSLFKKASVGDVADLKKETIPAAAAPQALVAPLTASPLAPAAISGAVVQPASVRYILAGLAVLAVIYFLKD